MKFRHLLNYFRNHLFENRSIRDQLEEYFLFSLVLALGIGLSLTLWQRTQLNQQLLQNLQQQFTLLQQQSLLNK